MSISEYPPLVHWIKRLSMFTQKASSTMHLSPVLKGGNRVRERGPQARVVCKNILLNYNSRNCIQELVLGQLSGYKFWPALIKPPDNYNWLCCWNGNEEATDQQPSSVFVDSFIFCCLLRGIDSRRDRASRSSKNASSLDSTQRRKYPLTRHC